MGLWGWLVLTALCRVRVGRRELPVVVVDLVVPAAWVVRFLVMVAQVVPAGPVVAAVLVATAAMV